MVSIVTFIRQLCCRTGRCSSPAVWIAFLSRSKVQNSTTQQRGLGVLLAHSPLPAKVTPRPCCPTAEYLVAGGFAGSVTLASAELYDPGSGTWANTASLATPHDGHSATLLPNGKVLVAGGNDGHRNTASAELYDPASGTWMTTGSLGTGRELQTTTLLPNGKMLVAGGMGTTALASAELYDSADGTWATTGKLVAVRYMNSATLLPSGKTIVSGGYDNSRSPFRARSSTIRRAAPGQLLAASTPHATFIQPPCSPMASCL